MKRIISALLPILALVVTSCAGGNGDTYTVKGTVAKSFMPMGNVSVILQHKDGSIDETNIEKRHFTFSGPADIEDIVAVALHIDGQPPKQDDVFATFVPEAGTIKILLDKKSVVKGGAINKALVEYDNQLNTYVETFFAESQKLVNDKGADDAAVEVDQLQTKLQENLLSLSKEVFDANANNSVGAYAFKNVMHDLSLQEMDEWLAKAADFIRNAPAVQTVREGKVALDATAEGKMFADFAGQTPDGKAVSLSDFVGKGKYALVDFWSSWCGPCKQEIPNIKEVFEKYGQDINVVGVAVWDMNNEGSRAVTEQYQMNWPQIFVGEDRTATDIYGINSIPHIILFAPDGKILKRDLRGGQIMTEVSSVLK